MIINVVFLFASLLYSIFLNILYREKEHIKSEEIKYFGYLITLNFFGIIIELLCLLFFKLFGIESIISIIFSKLILLYLTFFVFVFSKYVYYISFKESKNYIYNKLFSCLLMFFCLLIILLPISIYYENNLAYSYGPSVITVYIASTICVIFCVLVLLFKFRKLKSKKYIPVLFFTLIGGICALIQYLYPYLTLTTSMETFITFIMYFTIENPDVRLIEQLNIAKDAADRANSAKSDFLSNMSHEIRTPLNAIVGFSNGLLESNDLPETAKSDVKNIIMASDNLLELVNGILDISKIEAGKLEIIDVNYSFNKIFDELVLLTKARLGEKPLDFRYAYDSSVPEYLYGDGTRVKQIVLNLLTNAVKYTKTGYVDFKVNSVIKGDVVRLIISVEDSGIGIKKESVEKLFTKFERLGVEKDTTTEGTGLGLAITKKLTEMMGGTIVVQSEYGQGSKFTVSIDQKIVTGEELEKLKRENDNSVNTEEVVDGHGKRILVVDDNNLNIKVAERLLGKFNVVIDSCNSGFDCVNKITSGEKYDLLLLDDMMPKMSGTETLHKLKEVNGFSTPVIVLTANAITGMREKYLSEGFNDYLSKPIEKDELKRVIKQYLG